MKTGIALLALCVPLFAQIDAREKRETELQDKIAANPNDIAALTEFGLMKLADLREVPDRLGIEGEPMIARLLALREQDPPASRSDLALALEMEATALAIVGREGEATPLLARAHAIREENVHAMAAAAPDGPIEHAHPPAVSAPSVLTKIDPQYAEPARLAKVAGTVLLSAIVDVDGTPRDITLVRGAGFGLDEKAAEALAQRRFKPGAANGQPVPIRAQIEINFRLL